MLILENSKIKILVPLTVYRFVLYRSQGITVKGLSFFYDLQGLIRQLIQEKGRVVRSSKNNFYVGIISKLPVAS